MTRDQHKKETIKAIKDAKHYIVVIIGEEKLTTLRSVLGNKILSFLGGLEMAKKELIDSLEDGKVNK